MGPKTGPTEEEGHKLSKQTKDPDASEMISEIKRLFKQTGKKRKKNRYEAVTKLGNLGERIPTELRGSVVIRLLDLSGDNDKDIRENAGQSLMKLSKHWDLGKAIPHEQRDDVAMQVLKLYTKGYLYYVEWITEITRTDNWSYPEDRSLLSFFKNLWSKDSIFSILLELSQDEDPSIRQSVIYLFIEFKRKIPKDQQDKVIKRITEMTDDPDKDVCKLANEKLKKIKK